MKTNDLGWVVVLNEDALETVPTDGLILHHIEDDVATEIFVFNRGARDPLIQSQLSEWAPNRTLKVWVHFGETNSDAITRDEAGQRWDKLTVHPWQKVLANSQVNPFSLRSRRMLWDRTLRKVVDAIDYECRGISISDSERAALHEAWNAAQCYYDVALPLMKRGDDAFKYSLRLKGRAPQGRSCSDSDISTEIRSLFCNAVDLWRKLEGMPNTLDRLCQEERNRFAKRFLEMEEVCNTPASIVSERDLERLLFQPGKLGKALSEFFV
jgi:hypothetical protein